jgi:RNA polymerase sigma-70 factor (ECF subfamily)
MATRLAMTTPAAGSPDMTRSAADIHWQDEDDLNIVQRVLNGNRNDFELLMTRYQNYVFKIISGILPNEVVEEMAQDVFIEVYRSLSKFNDQMSFKKWLAGITVHRSYDYWRRYYRNREVPLSALTPSHQEWIDGIISHHATEQFERDEARQEASELLDYALAELSEKDRIALTLVYLEGLTVKEAAKVLGWSAINVRVRAHRSREKMRQKIAPLLQKEGAHV